MQKYVCVFVETECNEILSLILGRQRIDQKRKKGWGRERRERVEKGCRERIEKGSRDRERRELS